MEIKKIIAHEDYNRCDRTKKGNDIALLMLKQRLDSTYMPACLAPENEDYTGRVGSTYGWGTIADTTLGAPCQGRVARWSSPVLRMTTQTIISNRKCKKSTGLVYRCDPSTNTSVPQRAFYDGRVFGDMICAESPGRSPCRGDSGGALTVEENGKHTLVGVTSWSKGCAKVNIHCFMIRIRPSTMGI